MARPLEVTFRVLANSTNPQAGELLLEALGSTDDRIRLHAAEALLSARQIRGLLVLVKQIETFTPEMQEHLKKNRRGLEHALQQAIVHGDAEERVKGLQAIQWMETVELLPLLFALLSRESIPEVGLMRQTIQEVLHRFYDNLQADQHGAVGWWLPTQSPYRILDDVLRCLDQVLAKGGAAKGAEEAIEGLLILGHPDQEYVKKVFRHSDRNVRDCAYSLMKTSRHPGVTRLVNKFLGMPYLPPVVFDVFAAREDLEFVIDTLHAFPRRLNEHHQKNYKLITRIPWVERSRSLIEFVPDQDQVALVKLVMATGIPDEEKQYVLEWIMRNGCHGGKEAAAQMKQSFNEETLRHIVLDGLESANEDDQVWATHQLRSLALPETFHLLIDRLNSPIPSVQKAAREELQSFNLQTMLEMIETVDPVVCRRAGQLLLKIDPSTPDALRRELSKPGARNRVRAIRAATLMGLCDMIIDDLMMMLGDEDSIVRRTAVEALGTIDHADAHDAIMQAVSDSNPRVRISAESALKSIRKKSYQTPASRCDQAHV